MWFGHDQFSKTELPGRHMASVQNRFYWPDGRVSFLPNGNLEHCRHALMGGSVRGATFLRSRAIFNRPATASNPSLAPPKRALGFLLYEGGFVAVAGEWFGMWQSASMLPAPAAFQIIITMMGFLIFVALKDEEFS